MQMCNLGCANNKQELIKVEIAEIFERILREVLFTQIDGGDDRIRTCEGLLTPNGLANRRFQPLSHVSAWS